jgi:hypothetical protein
MKDSHYRTPRTLSECHFVPGYRSAERDGFTNAGHWLVRVASVFGLLALVPLVILGVV